MLDLNLITDPTISSIFTNLFSSAITLAISKSNNTLFSFDDISDYLKDAEINDCLEEDLKKTYNFSGMDIKAINVFFQTPEVIEIVSQLFTDSAKSTDDIELEFINFFFAIKPVGSKSENSLAIKVFSNILLIYCNVIDYKIKEGKLHALDCKIAFRNREIKESLNRIQKQIEDIISLKEIDNSKSQSNDRWISSSSINYLEIKPFRPFSNYYYRREEDQKIEDAICSKKNILVIGRPLSGKTRSITEALTKIHEQKVLIPKSDSDLLIFKINDEFRDFICFFDDINLFTNNSLNQHIFYYFREHNVQIIATCRSSTEYKELYSRLFFGDDIDLSTLFDTIIELKDIDKKTGEDIITNSQKKGSLSNFDGTIGSLFMDIVCMTLRFEKLSIYEQSILQSLAIMHKCGIYSEPFMYNLDWIKLICSQIFEISGKKLEWMKWIDNIHKSEFIKLNQNNVQTEEIYIEKIFFFDNKPLILFRELIDAFATSPDLFTANPNALFRFANSAYYEIGLLDRKKEVLHKLIKKLCEKSITRIPEESINYAYNKQLLGISYRVISEFDEDERIENAKKAIESSKISLEIFNSLLDHQNDTAVTYSNLGAAYRHYSNIIDDSEVKKQCCILAIDACENALIIDEYPKKFRATTYTIIAASYLIFSEFENKSKFLKLALNYCDQAIDIYSSLGYQIQVANTNNLKGKIFFHLAKEENADENCNAAIEVLNKALLIRTIEDFDLDYAATQELIGDIYFFQYECLKNNQDQQKGTKAYKNALIVYSNSIFNTEKIRLEDKREKLDKFFVSFRE